ncbi:MAG TPA: hypothetical protein VD999_03045 [Vitreimonas sp.]|nr:hypothetical protein [Vitreimonas sp.]
MRWWHVVVLIILATGGALFPVTVTAAVPNLKQIEDQVKKTVEERKHIPLDQRLPQFSPSPSPTPASFFTFAAPSPAPKPVAPTAPDATLYSWLGGRIEVRRQTGQLYLSVRW